MIFFTIIFRDYNSKIDHIAKSKERPHDGRIKNKISPKNICRHAILLFNNNIDCTSQPAEDENIQTM